MRYALVNCDIYTGENVLYDRAIVVDGPRIESLPEIDKVPKNLDVYDLKGDSIAPGFIDIQANGGGGKLFTDEPTGDCVFAMHEAHKHFGTTNFLPTLISTSYEKMIQAIDTIKSLMTDGKFGVLGLHLEGPYINEGKGGAHDKRHIRRISNEEIDSLLKRGKDTIKIFTIAPEVVEESYIKRMKDHGIIVAIGHTNATYEQAVQSFRSGVSLVTHLFNAMSQLTSREPGVVGAALNHDETYAGIIVDGFHVDFACVAICKKIKGHKLLLVTDAMPPVGSTMSAFKLGELDVICSDGKCVTKDGVLAGSALDMATAVRNCVQKIGIPLPEALRMASTYPAELLGLGNELGKIKTDYIANMVLFDYHLNVKGIVTNGEYEDFAK